VAFVLDKLSDKLSDQVSLSRPLIGNYVELKIGEAQGSRSALLFASDARRLAYALLLHAEDLGARKTLAPAESSRAEEPSSSARKPHQAAGLLRRWWGSAVRDV